jgi:hypothetical protein
LLICLQNWHGRHVSHYNLHFWPCEVGHPWCGSYACHAIYINWKFQFELQGLWELWSMDNNTSTHCVIIHCLDLTWRGLGSYTFNKSNSHHYQKLLKFVAKMSKRFNNVQAITLPVDDTIDQTRAW